MRPGFRARRSLTASPAELACQLAAEAVGPGEASCSQAPRVSSCCDDPEGFGLGDVDVHFELDEGESIKATVMRTDSVSSPGLTCHQNLLEDACARVGEDHLDRPSFDEFADVYNADPTGPVRPAAEDCFLGEVTDCMEPHCLRVEGADSPVQQGQPAAEAAAPGEVTDLAGDGPSVCNSARRRLQVDQLLAFLLEKEYSERCSRDAEAADLGEMATKATKATKSEQEEDEARKLASSEGDYGREFPPLLSLRRR